MVANFLPKKGNDALTKWITPARDRFRDRERDAIDHATSSPSTNYSSSARKAVVDFGARLNFGLGPAKSERHQSAVRARWDRDPAGIRRGPA